jgi:hypothetical protein
MICEMHNVAQSKRYSHPVGIISEATNFMYKIVKGRDYLRDLSVDGRIILKSMSEKWDVRISILIWICRQLVSRR